MKTIIVGAADENIRDNNMEYYLFEPHTFAYNNLISRYKHRPNIHIYNTGVWKEKTNLNFYNTRKADCSSVFKPNIEVLKDLTHDLKRFDIIEETIINVDTLDNLLSGIEDVQMLQIDVQGASYEVILGAQKILQNVKYVKCEAEHMSLYSGEKLSDDITSIMEKNGFVLSKVNRVVRWPRSKNPIFSDLTFKNKNI